MAAARSRCSAAGPVSPSMYSANPSRARAAASRGAASMADASAAAVAAQDRMAGKSKV